MLTVSNDNDKNKRIRRTATFIVIAVYVAIFIFFVEGGKGNGKQGYSQRFIATFSAIYLAVFGLAFLVMRKYLPIEGTSLRPDKDKEVAATSSKLESAINAATTVAQTATV